MRRREAAPLLAFAALLPAAILSRGALLDSAREILPPRPEVKDGPAGPGIAGLAAALGVFRAVAIDGLWLRAIRLQEDGDYFEAALLARAIARLEPRIDAVWTFQARQLAYDVTPSFPPGERWPWVLAAIDLLRKEALPLNPGSFPIHLELAFIHHHKIGFDLDEAGPLYRSRLAALFEGKDAAMRSGLDPGFLSRLAGELGVPLDPRAAGSHAYYWSRKGLDAGDPAADPGGAAALRRLAGVSLLQMYHAGRPVKAPLGEAYAFVPDLRFARAADLALEEAAAGDIEEGEAAAAREALLRGRANRALYLVISGRLPEAREAHAALAGAGGQAFDDLVVETCFGPEAGSRQGALKALAAAVEASVLLDLAAEEDLRRGFEALGDMLVRRAGLLGEETSLEAARRAVESRLASRWSGTPAWKPLAERLREHGERLAAPGKKEDFPETERLPFGLDILDPARYSDLARGPGHGSGARPR